MFLSFFGHFEETGYFRRNVLLFAIKTPLEFAAGRFEAVFLHSLVEAEDTV
jgi:hypothetical protein